MALNPNRISGTTNCKDMSPSPLSQREPSQGQRSVYFKARTKIHKWTRHHVGPTVIPDHGSDMRSGSCEGPFLGADAQLPPERFPDSSDQGPLPMDAGLTLSCRGSVQNSTGPANWDRKTPHHGDHLSGPCVLPVPEFPIYQGPDVKRESVCCESKSKSALSFLLSSCSA